jgi:signal transduction histidine kinase
LLDRCAIALWLPVPTFPPLVLGTAEVVVLIAAPRRGERPVSPEELHVLAEEQAALRRVATLVARGAAPEAVLAAVTEEVGRLLPVDNAGLARYEPDRMITIVASSGRTIDDFPVGRRWSLGGNDAATLVFETGRPVRADLYSGASGDIGVAAQKGGIGSTVGTPIIVEGRLWGVMAASSIPEQPLPPDTEARLASFTELLATAIANAESRARLARLGEEQAALRRVATLVARGTAQAEMFAAVAEEVGRLFRVEIAGMVRYESDGTATFVAAWGSAAERFAVGSRRRLGGKNLITTVFETGHPARLDDFADASGPLGVADRQTGLHSAVMAPIIVEGRLWGSTGVGSILEQALPSDTEARLSSFTELVATAIGNAESRAALAASRARIMAAADQARRQIERDLHDRAQQRLITLGLQLRAAQAAVPPQLGELDVKLSNIADGLTSVFGELREISHGIHPAILSEKGLRAALAALGRRSAVPVELEVELEQRLPEQVEVAAYHAVSEALTNAAKHAHASLVHVVLAACDTGVQLAIGDDGAGGADPRHGSGLVGLDDRVEALGGTLHIVSPAGGGTRLLIEIPLKRRDKAGSREP